MYEKKRVYPMRRRVNLTSLMGVFRHEPTGFRARASATMGALSRSRLSLNKIMIPITSVVKCYFWLHSSKNCELQTTCQLATCDDRHPCIGLRLSPYAIITHSFKRWQSVQPVSAIVSHAHLFVSDYFLSEFLQRMLCYVYF
ncbi:hypothetical protein TNCV_1362591 [Trichonephila clavipes]|nr:hypothetical protein TNCV_1362591 [Trichonephila clavipes]